MKPFGTMVIKPDAINAHDLGIIMDVLEKNGLTPLVMFEIPFYTKIMREYRIADIQYKECNNAEQEIKGCNVALSAYEKLFANMSGILLLFKINSENPDNFYVKMNLAKREIRQQIEADRGYYYVYLNGETPDNLVRMDQGEYRRRKQQPNTNINRAYINGVHLEDIDCFLSNFCLNFMIIKHVTSKSHEIKSLKNATMVINEKKNDKCL